MGNGTYIFRQGGGEYSFGKSEGNTSLLFGSGSSGDKESTNIANKRFMEFYLENSATSGDNRGQYLRFYLSGAGGGGEALRAFTTVNDVAASTAHGAHISLNFASTGTVTGMGIAGRNTLHLPNVALVSNVTMSAVQAEIYSDGSDSDPGGSTILSLFRAVNDGHADGMSDVDDDAFFFDVQGFADATGNMFLSTAPTTLAASLRILVGSTTYYLPLYSGSS